MNHVESGVELIPEWLARHVVASDDCGTPVYVIDSGWNRTNPDPRIAKGISIADLGEDGITVSDDDNDRAGHGTRISLMILSRAPSSTIVPVKILDSRLGTTPRSVIAAIDWSISRGARIINLSLSTFLKTAIPELYAACNRANDAGCIVVAAYDNRPQLSVPAIFDNVLGVAAGVFESRFAFKLHADGEVDCEAFAAGTRTRDGSVAYANSFAAATISGIIARIAAGRSTFPLSMAREVLAECSAAQWGQ